MAAVMLGGVFVRLALHPGFALGFADQFLGLTELDSLFFSEALRASTDEHHVRAIFEDLAGGPDGVLDALQRGGSAAPKGGAVHYDAVTFTMPFKIYVPTITRSANRPLS